MTEVRDLIPDGRNVIVSIPLRSLVPTLSLKMMQVTDQNKADYIRLVCQMKMTGAIRKQLAAFLEGFYDIIPRRWLFNDLKILETICFFLG